MTIFFVVFFFVFICFVFLSNAARKVQRSNNNILLYGRSEFCCYLIFSVFRYWYRYHLCIYLFIYIYFVWGSTAHFIWLPMTIMTVMYTSVSYINMWVSEEATSFISHFSPESPNCLYVGGSLLSDVFGLWGILDKCNLSFVYFVVIDSNRIVNIPKKVKFNL